MCWQSSLWPLSIGRRCALIAACPFWSSRKKSCRKPRAVWYTCRDVEVSEDARRLAEEAGKDPRVVELILQESQSVIRVRPGLIITEHRTGHILANAGIDASNTGVDAASGDDVVLLWPQDPDASARALSEAVSGALGYHVPVVINDSLGRPWRMGTVGFAIGVAGLEPVWDQVGERDLDGRTMQVTAPAMADALAAAASLVQGETTRARLLCGQRAARSE